MLSPSSEKDVGFRIFGLLSIILGGCSNSSLESDEELEELVSSLSTSCRY
jgi:hypothetical protein